MSSFASTAFSKIAFSPRHKMAREIFFVGFAYFIYSQVRGLAADHVVDAFGNAYHIVNIEEKLGIFRELALQTFVVSRGSLIDIFNIIYFYGLFPLLLPTAI